MVVPVRERVVVENAVLRAVEVTVAAPGKVLVRVTVMVEPGTVVVVVVAAAATEVVVVVVVVVMVVRIAFGGIAGPRKHSQAIAAWSNANGASRCGLLGKMSPTVLPARLAIGVVVTVLAENVSFDVA